MIGAALFSNTFWSNVAATSFSLVLFGVLVIAWNFLWHIPRKIKGAERDKEVLDEIYRDITNLAFDQWHWKTHSSVSKDQWFEDTWSPKFIELDGQCYKRLLEHFGTRIAGRYLSTNSSVPLGPMYHSVNDSHEMSLLRLEGCINYLRTLHSQRCSIIEEFHTIAPGGKQVAEGYPPDDPPHQL